MREYYIDRKLCQTHYRYQRNGSS